MLKRNLLLFFFLFAARILAANADTLTLHVAAQGKLRDFDLLQTALNSSTGIKTPLKIVLKGTFQVGKTLILKRENTILDFNKATLKLLNEDNGGIIVAGNNITIKNGNVIGNGKSTKDFYKGYAVLFSGSDRGAIKNMTFEKISGNTIFLANAGAKGCTNTVVQNNLISFPALQLADDSDSFGILLGYSGYNYVHANNIIIGNRIDGDNRIKIGIGIIGHGNNNTFKNNEVKNVLDYGIMAYESQPVGNTLQQTCILDNRIENIGAVGSKKTVKGMGIYLMKSHNSTVAGNVVINVLRNSDRTETLTQGAIAASGSENLKINNNSINGSEMYGIVTAFGFNSEIKNNNINNIKKSAVYLLNLNDLKIEGNTFSNIAEVVLKGNFSYTGTKNFESFGLLSKYKNLETGKNITINSNKFLSPKEIIYFCSKPENKVRNLIKNTMISNNIFIGTRDYKKLIRFENSETNTIRTNNNIVK